MSGFWASMRLYGLVKNLGSTDVILQQSVEILCTVSCAGSKAIRALVSRLDAELVVRRVDIELFQGEVTVRKFVFYIFVSLCASCSFNHGRAIATLNYSGVEHTPGSVAYQIGFTADTDLLGLFESAIGEGLVCALEDDVDFSIGHYIKRSGRGAVEYVKDPVGGHYVSRVMFRETGESEGEENLLTGEALGEVLKTREFIVCSFRVHTTKYKTYFSNPMPVPTSDLLGVLGR
ncbi:MULTISPECIES: hypothetical protein [Pseudomonas]|uniref:hypothetical protein n=1 Tax=Pseudomonas TaxID=286 RepID=UPI000A8AA053|nr:MULTISPECIES: hypothetical protein [Pseudomonas]